MAPWASASEVTWWSGSSRGGPAGLVVAASDYPRAVDDETGWNEILVEGWGPLVRAAVCHRVVDVFRTRLGLLAATAATPDDAPADWVEDVHVAVVQGIRTETGADIEELGSQAAWATYDEVWQVLPRAVAAVEDLVPVPEARVGQVQALVAELPLDAALLAGAVPWPDGPTLPVVVDGRPRVNLEGLFRWLATEQRAAESHRALARALVAVVRGDPLT